MIFTIRRASDYKYKEMHEFNTLEELIQWAHDLRTGIILYLENMVIYIDDA